MWINVIVLKEIQSKFIQVVAVIHVSHPWHFWKRLFAWRFPANKNLFVRDCPEQLRVAPNSQVVQPHLRSYTVIEGRATPSNSPLLIATPTWVLICWNLPMEDKANSFEHKWSLSDSLVSFHTFGTKCDSWCYIDYLWRMF